MAKKPHFGIDTALGRLEIKDFITLLLSSTALLVTLYTTFTKTVRLNVVLAAAEVDMEQEQIAFFFTYFNSGNMPISISEIELFSVNANTDTSGMCELDRSARSTILRPSQEGSRVVNASEVIDVELLLQEKVFSAGIRRYCSEFQTIDLLGNVRSKRIPLLDVTYDMDGNRLYPLRFSELNETVHTIAHGRHFSVMP